MPTSIDPGSFTEYGRYNTDRLTLPNEYGLNYPDYNHILEMLLAPLKAQEAERLAALQAQTDAQMELAKRGTQLTMDDLSQQKAQAQKNIMNTLAASGLIDSGAKEYKGTQLDHSYKRQQQQVANNLTAQLMALANSLANAQLSSKQGIADYTRSLLPQIQSTYQPTPVYSGPAAPVSPYGAYNPSALQLPKGYG